MACQITSDDHLNLERLAFVADCHARIRDCHLPIGQDVGSGIQELGSNPVQHLSLIGNAFR